MWRGFSWKFHVTPISRHNSTWWWFGLSWHQTPCHLSRFYLFSMLEHDMDFGQGQVMEFPWHLLRTWRDFHRIWSHFRTKPNWCQKDIRKPISHFWQGFNNLLLIVINFKIHSVPCIQWNLCTKCDRSHFSSNSMTIPCNLSRLFMSFPWKNTTWILDKVKSWKVHGIC